MPSAWQSPIPFNEADWPQKAMFGLVPNAQLASRACIIARQVVRTRSPIFDINAGGKGVPAIAAYLSCQEINAPFVTPEFALKASQLDKATFDRTLAISRAALEHNPANIVNVHTLALRFGGGVAVHYMPPIMTHFRQSCIAAKIVDTRTWEANLMLVTAAVYCWTCAQLPEAPDPDTEAVAVFCGLPLDNLMRSMDLNVRPHCTMELIKLIEATPPSSLPPLDPTGKLPTPYITANPYVAKPTLGAFQALSSRSSSPQPATTPAVSQAPVLAPAQVPPPSVATTSDSNNLPTLNATSSFSSTASSNPPAQTIILVNPQAQAPARLGRPRIPSTHNSAATTPKATPPPTAPPMQEVKPRVGRRKLKDKDVGLTNPTPAPVGKAGTKPHPNRSRPPIVPTTEANKLFHSPAPGEYRAMRDKRVLAAWKKKMEEGLEANAKALASKQGGILDFVMT